MDELTKADRRILASAVVVGCIGLLLVVGVCLGRPAEERAMFRVEPDALGDGPVIGRIEGQAIGGYDYDVRLTHEGQAQLDSLVSAMRELAAAIRESSAD